MASKSKSSIVLLIILILVILAGLSVGAYFLFKKSDVGPVPGKCEHACEAPEECFAVPQ